MPLAVNIDPSDWLHGGTNASVTTTASALGASRDCDEVLVQASADNTDAVLVGDASGQYLELVPGAGISIPIQNVDRVHVKSASGTQAVNYLARGA